jgi:hypothetical protein
MKGVLHVMFPYQFRGEDLVMGFPGVTICVWIALPLDKVLEFAPSAMMMMVLDGLDLELLFAVNYLRWRFRKVDPMLLGFT